MSYHFSKSRYCNGVQCKKMLWLFENMPDAYDGTVKNQTVLESGNDVGDLAMGLFGEYKEVPFSKNLSEMISCTEKLLEDGVENICEASFSYDDCFCSVDILRNLGNKNDEPECKIDKHCSNPYACGFWKFCAKDMPKDGGYTVWDIANFRKAQEFYDKALVLSEGNGRFSFY